MWGSTDFEEQFRVADRRYIKARIFVQALVQPGMLISEDLLATRLGIDRSSSAVGNGLREATSAVFYSGVAADSFVLWWARGLEAWWEERSLNVPLAATPIADRHRALSEKFPGLAQIRMPSVSPSDRPWRGCEITKEETGAFLHGPVARRATSDKQFNA